MGKLQAHHLVPMISQWLPEPARVQMREQMDWTYRVDIETCGGQAHFFISAEPEEWRHEWIKPVVDAALHSIWSQGLAKNSSQKQWPTR